MPEGYRPNTLFASSGLEGSVYEPNQFVLNCGYVDPTAGPIRIASRISKNLQSGDSIQLICASATVNDVV